MEQDQERKNKRIGTAVSVGIHALLLILFAFILAWREPDPPLPEYGIEINFGLADQGSGDVQPQAPVSQEVVEEDEPAPQEQEAEVSEPAEESEPVEETIEEVAESVPEPVNNTQESPEVIPEQPEKKPEPKPENKVEEKTEPKPQPKPQEETNQSGNEGAGQAAAAESSQGDDEDKEGDKGIEEGKVDARALYGKPGGGGGGPSLQIVGWMWDEEPRKKDSSNENGMVTFEFLIDEEGYVIRIVTLERSVSPSVAKFYEEQLRQTTFSRTGTGTARPGNTKGTVTFSIVSK